MSSGFPWATSNTGGLGNLSNIIVRPKLIMNKTYYIGLDVHNDIIALAIVSFKL